MRCWVKRHKRKGEWKIKKSSIIKIDQIKSKNEFSFKIIKLGSVRLLGSREASALKQ